MQRAIQAAVIALAALFAPAALADILIVGSSTVYPFATVVGERYGQVTGLPSPRIESTGTGGGMQLLCSKSSPDSPRISNASRRIKKSEIKLCADNGVGKLVEVKIGFDGIVLAQSLGGPQIELTRAQLFSALARELPDAAGKLAANPNRNWSDINPSLPEVKIQVYGPPPTSGTRDAFVELVMEKGCEQMPGYELLDKDQAKSVCHSLREDGTFIEAGENDNLIIQRLATNDDAFGIFGYSFLEENADRVRGIAIEGVEPTFESIADSTYQVSRPLFFYVQQSALQESSEIASYVEFFASEAAIGEDGFLSDRGLIPLPAEQRDEVRSTVSQRTAVSL